MKRRKLGEILLEEGLITDEQLGTALTIQKGKNKKLGKVLIEIGYINDMQVAEALTKQLSLQMVDCKDYNPSMEILSLVPKEIAESKLVLPLELKNKNLLIAQTPIRERDVERLIAEHDPSINRDAELDRPVGNRHQRPNDQVWRS